MFPATLAALALSFALGQAFATPAPRLRLQGSSGLRCPDLAAVQRALRNRLPEASVALGQPQPGELSVALSASDRALQLSFADGDGAATQRAWPMSGTGCAEAAKTVALLVEGWLTALPWREPEANPNAGGGVTPSPTLSTSRSPGDSPSSSPGDSPTTPAAKASALGAPTPSPLPTPTRVALETPSPAPAPPSSAVSAGATAPSPTPSLASNAQRPEEADAGALPFDPLAQADAAAETTETPSRLRTGFELDVRLSAGLSNSQSDFLTGASLQGSLAIEAVAGVHRGFGGGVRVTAIGDQTEGLSTHASLIIQAQRFSAFGSWAPIGLGGTGELSFQLGGELVRYGVYSVNLTPYTDTVYYVPALMAAGLVSFTLLGPIGVFGRLAIAAEPSQDIRIAGGSSAVITLGPVQADLSGGLQLAL